ncbi:MAG: 3-deoxy-D-manno-octulosonic acid transferase [Candidatus Omnitrophica bacterium]|nr:3-deoxy-D-manno-octulosonic acid transferase [Candidatus Omnitrophota bacterium]
MFILYDIIFILFAVLYFPYVIIKGKWHAGFWARLGFVGAKDFSRLRSKKNIWIHAVSVGEVLAIVTLIEEMKQQCPEHQIVVSTVTPTGYALARQKLSKEDVIIFAPLDFSWIVRHYAKLIHPEIYVTAETEIWPNLFLALSKRGIPVIQVNGRISDKAYRRYRRVRFILKKVLGCVSAFCMQSRTDASKVVALGAPSSKVQVVGNVKFDGLSATTPYGFADIGLEDQTPLWVAGSTHPGEEEIVLDVFKKLKSEFPDLRLLIAPRHVERAGEVAQIVKQADLSPVRFSQIKKASISEDAVIVVDEIGHLRGLYGLAKIVFVGKSLIGHGGQNILEPAAFGKPIFIGPNMQNFKDIAQLFLDADAVVQVKDANDLLVQLSHLLNNPQKMDLLSQKAQDLVQKHQGATAQTLQIIAEFLPEKIK